LGEYKEKIKKHFWMLVSSTIDEIRSVKAYREKFEPVFKIKSNKVIKLVEDPLWSKVYSLTRNNKDPDVLRKNLGPIVQIDIGKARDHIWHLLIFSVSDPCDERTFREHFEPIFRFNAKKAIKLVEDHLWSTLYSLTKETQDPEELNKLFEPLLKIDVKKAAEAIKEVNPEKYKFLQIFK
jgi:hypothetical protein